VDRAPLIFGSTLFLVLVLFRHMLEANPTTHMLVLLPLLAASGYLVLSSIALHRVRINRPAANSLVLVAVFAILFWMLPRNIDASITELAFKAAKFTTIPLLVGGALALAWHRSNPYLQGFLKANALSMLGVLAFLYTHAPARLCSSYLAADQVKLGYGFLWIALALCVVWCWPLFFPMPRAAAFEEHSLSPARL